MRRITQDRHGPVRLPAQQLTVWPQAAAYDSTAEAPQPDGLVGAHRARQVGSGTEFAGIRTFAPGDRLRRISWPVSLRTRELQVVTTRAEQDASVAQVAIAWVASRGDDIVPLVGARRRDRLHEALGATQVQLSAADLARIEEVVPAGAAAGTRYDAYGMSQLDSER